MTTAKENVQPQGTGLAPSGWELTGNHSVAFPLIDRANGAIHRVGVLHRGANGVVEWAGADGEPLLQPRLSIDGAAVELPAPVWERLDAWIPRFTVELADRVRLHGTICAPPGHEASLRGAVYILEIENRGRAERAIDVTLQGTWRRTLRRILTERLWGDRNRVAALSGGVVLEAASGAALAVISGGTGEPMPSAISTPAGSLDPFAGTWLPNGDPATLSVGRSLRVAAGKRALVAFFIGVAPEADGAVAMALGLRSLGATELLRRARLELARLARTPERSSWTAFLGRALFFNYFFAVGRALDDDRFYAVSSRSPLLPDGACFRERDALLWSLPAITLLDPWLGREMLLRSFEQYAHRAGERLHYIDGGVLAPGFALDQAVAYGVALDRYARDVRDEHVHEDPIIQDVLRELDEILFHRLHADTFLAATELLPSGDPADHPFVTYDNALLRVFCRALERLWVAEAPDDRPQLAGGADEIEAAVWRECTANVDRTPLLAWSVNLSGDAAIYDDPAGSLALLPAIGFCDSDEPVWRETLEFLRSKRYPFWLEGPFPGLAARRHPAAAGLAALASDLLGPRRDPSLELLGKLHLEEAIACEAWDPQTGQPAAGSHYAALAGFVGWALWEALEGVTRR